MTWTDVSACRENLLTTMPPGGGGPRSRAASTDGEQFVDPTRRVRVHAREHVGQVRDRVGEIGIPIFSAELPESTFLLPNEDRPLFAVEPTSPRTIVVNQEDATGKQTALKFSAIIVEVKAIR